MAITSSTVSTSNTLEQFRVEFNKLRTDVVGLETGTLSSLTTTTVNVQEDGTIIFEGATDDNYETTLTVVDPTADRTITFPNASGTVIISDSSTNVTTLPDDLLIKDGGTIGNASVADVMTLAATGIVTFKDDLLIKDGGTIGSASSTGAITIASTGIVTFVDDILIKDGGTIGSASATGAITIASTGIVTFVDDILIKDAGTIGSASDTDAISISSGGVVNISATTANTSASDGALTVAGGVGIAADLSVGDDLRLISDSAVLSFGGDSDVTVTHDPDDGLILKSTATADDNPFLLTLQTGETDIAQDDVIGKISFQAPDEGTGTDAILIAAAIQAVSEGDFSSSNNATTLEFLAGSSATARKVAEVTSAGLINTYIDGGGTATAIATVDDATALAIALG